MIFLNKIIYGSVTVKDFIIGIGIVIISLLAVNLIKFYLKRFLKDKVNRYHSDIIIKSVYYTIFIILIISVLPLFGLNASGLLVAGGVTGLIIGFASQKVVSNLISGFFIMIERPIKIGQQVNISDIAGFVEEINIFSTIIRTYDGLYVRIPNENVFTTNIRNYVFNLGRRFEYVVGIRYSDKAGNAVKIIEKILDEYPLVFKEPAPQVFVDSLGESSVDISIRIWAPINEWFYVKMKLLNEIKEGLEKEGIEIPFPQRVLWFANKEQGK